MGCNFYTLSGMHIGKRSAAGNYCWDCHITLCKDGEQKIHDVDSNWYDKCPKCGQKPIKETLEQSAAGRELGFNKNHEEKKGIRSVSSFTWAIKPECLKRKRIVTDEYGMEYTMKQFQAELAECPICYTHLIGQEFS